MTRPFSGRALVVGGLVIAATHAAVAGSVRASTAPVLVAASPTPPQPAAITALRARIDARLAALKQAVPTAEVAVALRDLGSGTALDLASDVAYHPASTMKVPVMIELFRQVEAGRLSLDQEVLLVNRFGSIVDGSPYALDAADDSDSSLYAMVGQRVTLRELDRRMIVRSSNLATNALIAIVGAPNATATAHALGASARTQVLRGVEDGPAFRAGMNNVITAADLATLLAAIEQRRAATATSCDEMLSVLRAQEFNDAIPAGIPRGTPVAHKTGSITGVLHDGAIVYPPGKSPYVLVVLTRGVPQPADARAAIVDISRLVWEAQTGAVAGRCAASAAATIGAAARLRLCAAARRPGRGFASSEAPPRST